MLKLWAETNLVQSASKAKKNNKLWKVRFPVAHRCSLFQKVPQFKLVKSLLWSLESWRHLYVLSFSIYTTLLSLQHFSRDTEIQFHSWIYIHGCKRVLRVGAISVLNKNNQYVGPLPWKPQIFFKSFSTDLISITKYLYSPSVEWRCRLNRLYISILT